MSAQNWGLILILSVRLLAWTWNFMALYLTPTPPSFRASAAIMRACRATFLPVPRTRMCLNLYLNVLSLNLRWICSPAWLLVRWWLCFTYACPWTATMFQACDEPHSSSSFLIYFFIYTWLLAFSPLREGGVTKNGIFWCKGLPCNGQGGWPRWVLASREWSWSGGVFTVVRLWVGLDSSSSPPCAPIHRMCSMNSYPSPPAAAASCWNVPHPFLNALDSHWLGGVDNQAEEPTSRRRGLERPMMEAGRREVAWLVVWWSGGGCGRLVGWKVGLSSWGRGLRFSWAWSEVWVQRRSPRAPFNHVLSRVIACHKESIQFVLKNIYWKEPKYIVVFSYT